jgi:hypothetical protein
MKCNISKTSSQHDCLRSEIKQHPPPSFCKPICGLSVCTDVYPSFQDVRKGQISIGTPAKLSHLRAKTSIKKKEKNRMRRGKEEDKRRTTTKGEQ